MLPNYYDVINALDKNVLDTIFLTTIFNVVELLRVYSLTQFSNPTEMISAIALISQIENIIPIVDNTLTTRIDILLFDHVDQSSMFSFLMISNWFNTIERF